MTEVLGNRSLVTRQSRTNQIGRSIQSVQGRKRARVGLGRQLTSKQKIIGKRKLPPKPRFSISKRTGRRYYSVRGAKGRFTKSLRTTRSNARTYGVRLAPLTQRGAIGTRGTAKSNTSGLIVTLIYGLEEINKQLTDIMRYMERIAEITALQACPVDTGRLKGSLQLNSGGTGFSITAMTHYMGYVENGTSRMAAQPYIRPAADQVQGEVQGGAVRQKFRWRIYNPLLGTAYIHEETRSFPLNIFFAVSYSSTPQLVVGFLPLQTVQPKNL